MFLAPSGPGAPRQKNPGPRQNTAANIPLAKNPRKFTSRAAFCRAKPLFLLASNSNSSAPVAPAHASTPWKSPRPPAASAPSHTGSLPPPKKQPPRQNPPADPAVSPESGRKDTPPTLYFRRALSSGPSETIPAPGNSPSRRVCPSRPPSSSSTVEFRRGLLHTDPAPRTPPRSSPSLY